MGGRDIVVIGASAGGLGAADRLLKGLPADFGAAVFVALHRPLTPFRDELAEILSSRGLLPAHIAVDLQQFERGHIYICPRDRHLSLEKGNVRVECGPKENRFRPSVDILFRSAASTYGRRVVGVVLTGYLDDGTAGLWHIKKHGGVAIVQDPADAQFSSMPQSAIENVDIDYVLPLKRIGEKLVELTRGKLPENSTRQTPPKVLIVEDERVVAKALVEHLTDLRYQVIGSVESGERAIEMAAESSPDVVLMDIRLAGKITGVEAAKRIWERSQIPVIFLTAYSDQKTLERVKTTESYGYIVKPFHSKAVHANIQLALDRREKELRNF